MRPQRLGNESELACHERGRQPCHRAEQSAGDGSISSNVNTGTLLKAAWVALESIHDPELCLDVVALGLVYDVRIKGDTVTVGMTLTTPGCPAAESLPEMARMALQEALGPVAVEVRVVWGPPWSPATMNDDDAASVLGFRAG